MASYPYGKDKVVEWVRKNFPKESTVLDVGPCDGMWKLLLPEYEDMDAVEIFPPNADRCKPLYRNVFCADIAEFEYDWYDLIIMADVLEHMSVEKAQEVLRYAWNRCKDFIVALPFQLPQEAIYGNPWEFHVQADLTASRVRERYPELAVLHDAGWCYCYYHKGRIER